MKQATRILLYFILFIFLSLSIAPQLCYIISSAFIFYFLKKSLSHFFF